MQIGNRYILQEDAVVSVNRDQSIVSRGRCSAKRRSRIGKYAASEFENVAARREIGYDVLTEIAAENERIAARSTDQEIVASSAVDRIGIAVASQRIREATAGQVLDAAIGVARRVARVAPGAARLAATPAVAVA